MKTLTYSQMFQKKQTYMHILSQIYICVHKGLENDKSNSQKC